MTAGAGRVGATLSIVALLVVALAGLIVNLAGAPNALGDPTAGRHPASSRPSYIRAASWESTPLGYRLIVWPSRRGRAHAAAAPGRALRQAVAAARPTPLHLSARMRRGLTDQLHCHAAFAPDKPRWDLESWRPDVGYARTVFAACNP